VPAANRSRPVAGLTGREPCADRGWPSRSCSSSNGAVLASWLPHIPAVKARLTSGDGQLGLVLLAMAAGAVVALPTAAG